MTIPFLRDLWFQKVWCSYPVQIRHVSDIEKNLKYNVTKPNSNFDLVIHILPDINQKQRNKFFNLDDFNSDEKGQDTDHKKKNGHFGQGKLQGCRTK